MGHAFKIDRVLFATDLSPACEPALRCATALASRFNAELYLLHVLPTVRAANERHPAPHASERHATEAMRRLRQELLATHDNYSMAMLSGDPAARILQKAEDVHADLIVMGTSAHCPHPGGYTDQVVRGASCPVLAVPHAPPQRKQLGT
jgi:nucleotide-binding universal stress UspA family protein